MSASTVLFIVFLVAMVAMHTRGHGHGGGCGGHGHNHGDQAPGRSASDASKRDRAHA